MVGKTVAFIVRRLVCSVASAEQDTVQPRGGRCGGFVDIMFCLDENFKALIHLTFIAITNCMHLL